MFASKTIIYPITGDAAKLPVISATDFTFQITDQIASR